MRSEYPSGKRPGNGLSKVAMVYKIATIARQTLSPKDLNKVKAINPRHLENAYSGIVQSNDEGNAKFILNLLLK